MTERDIVRSTQFRRDTKLAIRRHGKPILNELAMVLQRLVADEPLDERNHDHQLVSWTPPARECHIRPDILLIYRLTNTTVQLVRLGSHADLF